MGDKVRVINEDTSLFLAPATLKNCFLNWLVPGLGYWLLGRKRECLIMASALGVAFLLAIFQGGDLFDFSGEGKIRGIGAFCQLGMGFPYILAKLFLGRGTPLNTTYDYGTNYFLIAGMINWLAVLDIFDISVKRK